jgi:hypothetical protein
MSQASDMHREGGRGLAVIGDIGSVLFRLIRLPVYGVLVICEPIVQIGLSTIALLGLVATLFLSSLAVRHDSRSGRRCCSSAAVAPCPCCIAL